MKIPYILAIASWLIIWGMGAWAFVFFLALRDGVVVIYEPNLVILIVEFATASIGVLVGTVLLIFGIKKGKGS